MNDYYFKCSKENHSKLLRLLEKLGFTNPDDAKECFLSFPMDDGDVISIMRTNLDLLSKSEDLKNSDTDIQKFLDELSKYCFVDDTGKMKQPDNPIFVFL